MSYFGPMRKILGDVGGENVSEDFKRYCEGSNIELQTTAAEAQFSNGIVERHGGLLSDQMRRMRADLPRVNRATLLSKALLVHNDTATFDGSTPLQRLVGKSAHLPSILVDGPSAMDRNPRVPGDVGPRISHLQALDSARISFAYSLASQSLRQALACRTHPSAHASYAVDDQVYFYDAGGKAKSEWRGPAKVIGFSPRSKIVTILYGRSHYLRHTSKVRSTEDSHFDHPPGSQERLPGSGSGNLDAVSISSSNNHVPGQISDLIDIDAEVAEFQPEIPGEIPVLPDHLPRLPVHPAGDAVVDDFIPEENLNIYQLPHVPDVLPKVGPPRRSSRQQQPHYHHDPQRQYYPDHWAFVVDLIRERQNRSRLHEVLAVNRSREVPITEQSEEFDAAKSQEISDIRSHQAIRAIHISDLPEAAQVIDTRFVCEYKDNDSGARIPKARLVAKGFQEVTGDDAVDAPTVTRSGVRMILTLAVLRRWIIRAVDFKRAFLQARNRGSDDSAIAIIPPPEAGEADGIVWLLLKSIYGLRSAPREWWLTLYAALIDIGFSQSKHDPAIFIYRDKSGCIIGVIALHVDDMLAAGSKDFDAVLDQCEAQFRIGSRKADKFTYLGLEVVNDASGNISLSQSRYIAGLSPVHIPVQGHRSGTELPQNTL